MIGAVWSGRRLFPCGNPVDGPRPALGVHQTHLDGRAGAGPTTAGSGGRL